MDIDLEREKLIPLADVPRLPWVPRRRRGRRLHVATVYRWCLHGIRGHKLEYAQVGGAKATTETALMRFFEALTAAETTAPHNLTKKRERQLREVDAQLDSAGFNSP